MIEAVIFDLDGTLVETEELKAQSYARAAAELRPDVSQSDVLAYFPAVVGLSRREVALALIERFMLEDAARTVMPVYGVDTPWQAFVQVRLNIYDQLLYDPDLLHRAAYKHNLALLREIRQAGVRVGLATMSYCAQVQRVLGILGLRESFDFVATRDDVEHGKPDPEIYQLVAHELGVAPSECMVVEDSPTGVQAGLAAGMNVIAVTTALTRPLFRDTTLLDHCWVVDDPATLPDVVRFCVLRHQQAAHGGADWNFPLVQAAYAGRAPITKRER